MKKITQKMISILSIALTITLFGPSTLFGAAEPASQMVSERNFRRMSSQERTTFLNRQLFAAINNGNYDTVFQALQNGASPNALNQRRSSALAVAAGMGQRDMVELLLLYGARDIQNAQLQVQDRIENLNNQKSTLEQTHDTEIATAMNESRLADIDTINTNFNAQIAQHQAQLDIFNDINTQLEAANNSTQITANNKLLQAVKSNDSDMVTQALNEGATPHARDARNGDTPLIIAARNGNREMVQLILKQINNQTEAIVALTAANAQGNTAIEDAIRVAGKPLAKVGASGAKYHTGKPEIIELLTNFARDNNATIVLNRRNPKWHLRTPLHSVVRRVEGDPTTAKAGFIDSLSAMRMIIALTKDNPNIINLGNERGKTAQQELKQFSYRYLKSADLKSADFDAMYNLLSNNPDKRAQGRQEYQNLLPFQIKPARRKKKKLASPVSDGTSETSEELFDQTQQLKDQITEIEGEMAKIDKQIKKFEKSLTDEKTDLKEYIKTRRLKVENPESGRIYNAKIDKIKSLERDIDREQDKLAPKQSELKGLQKQLEDQLTSGSSDGLSEDGEQEKMESIAIPAISLVEDLNE